jgi:ABC-type dipeptide/oligopeptide/nickel transport system permease component
MIGVVLRRIASSAVLLLVVSFVAHLLVLPGTDNVARNVLGEAASEDQVAAKAAELGLDQPFLVRYGDWLVSALSGDLGRSYFNPQSVMDAVLYRFPVTLWVIIFVTVSVGLLAFAAGNSRARYRHQRADWPWRRAWLVVAYARRHDGQTRPGQSAAGYAYPAGDALSSVYRTPPAIRSDWTGD